MAQNITYTTNVDVVLKSGKVDSSLLNKELPRLMEQAVGNMPGGSILLSPDVKIDPKLDANAAKAQVEKILNSPELANIIGTKKGDDIEKTLVKYRRAFEDLANVSTVEKFNLPQSLGIIKKIQGGETTLSEELKGLNKKQQESLRSDIQNYLNYQDQVSKVFSQVASYFPKINDKLILPSQEKELDDLREEAKAIRAEIKKSDKAVDSLSSQADKLVKKKKDSSEIQSRLSSVQDARDKQQESLASLEEAISAKEKEIKATKIGALINPQLSGYSRDLAEGRKTLLDQLKATDKQTKAQDQYTDTLNQSTDILRRFVNGKQLKDTKALQTELSKLGDEDLSLFKKEAIQYKKDLEKGLRVDNPEYYKDKSYQNAVGVLRTVGRVEDDRKEEARQLRSQTKLEQTLDRNQQVIGKYLKGELTGTEWLTQFTDVQLDTLKQITSQSRNTRRRYVADAKLDPLKDEEINKYGSLITDLRTEKTRRSKQVKRVEKSDDLGAITRQVEAMISNIGGVAPETLLTADLRKVKNLKHSLEIEQAGYRAQLRDPETYQTALESERRQLSEDQLEDVKKILTERRRQLSAATRERKASEKSAELLELHRSILARYIRQGEDPEEALRAMSNQQFADFRGELISYRKQVKNRLRKESKDYTQDADYQEAGKLLS